MYVRLAQVDIGRAHQGQAREHDERPPRHGQNVPGSRASAKDYKLGWPGCSERASDWLSLLTDDELVRVLEEHGIDQQFL